MSKENEVKAEKNIGAIEEALSNTEHFIEKNQKVIMYVVGALIVVVLGYFGYKKLYMEPKEEEAKTQMFAAERYFGKDSLKLALNGDGQNPGFLQIIDEYGMTKSANIAHYCAGMCYLKLGQYEEAITQLKDFDSDDQLVSSMALGAIGDAYMELGDNEKAISHYLKASDNNNNMFSTPLFLFRAASVYEIMGNYEEAIKLYERIQKEYYKTFESRDIEKYIARAKGLQKK